MARFISKLTNRCRLFFQTLCNKGEWDWGPQQLKAFADLKAYLTYPPVMVVLAAGEPFFLYFSISKFVISSVLFLEHKGM